MYLGGARPIAFFDSFALSRPLPISATIASNCEASTGAEPARQLSMRLVRIDPNPCSSRILSRGVRRAGVFAIETSNVWSLRKTPAGAHVDANVAKSSPSGRGEVSTAALDSLRIVAFDLAAVAVEEKADLPAFLVHDSPREADFRLTCKPSRSRSGFPSTTN